MNDYSQKHLLFALLACQNELITKPQLVAAFSVWLSDRSKGLDLILVDQGSLSELQRSVLDSLVDLHLAKHGDLQKSLAQLSSMDGIAQELHSLALPDVAATLPPVFSEYATSLHLPNSSKNPASSKISNADDRFRIIRHHANGGLGVVHVAEDQQLRRQVALKQIRADCADYDSYRTKFVQEAEITGQLEHPGIVPVYGLGTDAAGRPYYAMRFIKGEELKTRIQSFHAGRKNKSQSLDTPELRNLLRRFTDICDAIDYAHDRGVLHRDLKPGNVMLGKHGETLVVDWGLAKPMKQAPEADPWSTVRPSFELPIQPSGSNDNSATAYGSFLGTPAYAPPEQISGELDKLCPQSDVYSLGAILYEILAGRPPVEKANSQAMLLSIHTNNKIPAPRSLDASIPKPLNAICQKAISFNIVDRYTSAAELKTEIERWLDDSPVQAFPDPLLQRTRRWLRKHPRSVAAVATMALVGITSAVTISAIVGQKNQQLAQANSDLTEANASRLAATVALLEQAPAEAVPTLLQGMESVREKILPTLESHWALGGLPNSQRVRLALALLPSDESVDDFLKSQLLAVPPADSIMIRNALKSRGQELTPSLWRITEAADTLPEKRLRAAAALAEFDPQSPRWNEVARPTVAAMLAANPLDWGTWIDGLRPVREYLIPALAERFRDHTAVEQCYGAALVCAEYAADRPEILADLAADADPRQFSVLFPRLQSQVESVASALERELTLSCAPEWDMNLLPATRKPVDGDIARRIEQSEGMVTDAFAFCVTLPIENFKTVHEDLVAAGYFLARLRPYAATDSVQIAATWQRDGRTGEYLLAASPEEIQNRDATLRAKGLLPVDVAGYLDAASEPQKTVERYAAVWQQLPAEAHQRELVVGDTEQPEVDRASYLVLQEFLGTEGKPRYCTLGGNAPHGSLPIWKRDTASYLEMLRRTRHFAQQDVCVSAASRSDAILRATAGLFIQASEKDFSYQYAAVFSNLPAVDSCELHGLTPAEHAKRTRELATEGWRPWAISVWAPSKKPMLVASVWQHPLVTDERKEKLAKRQAQAAAALMLLGRPEKTWSLFQHTVEPRTRSWLIHSLSPLSVPPGIIIDQLARESNISAQRALWLAVGELAEKLDDATRAKLGPQLEKIYREHADSGIHAAAEWTLRRLQYDSIIDKADRDLVSSTPIANRAWYVNQHGHTLAIFQGPVEFVQGSTKGEPDQDIVAETPMRVRIGRTFAMATKEVNTEQYRKFKDDVSKTPLFISQLLSSARQCPIGSLTWFDAAKYCRWLSEKEGIPEEEMCYPPLSQIKDGMKLPANYLRRTGYRLSTEAEWEFACRAGASTSRCYGGSSELLGHYARFVLNSNDRTWPVGQFKPNDFGLFDMHGNIWEWCHEGAIELPSSFPEVIEDREETNLKVTAGQVRMVRGGSFDRNAKHIRSASRLRLRTTDEYLIVGLRVARTLPDAKP